MPTPTDEEIERKAMQLYGEAGMKLLGIRGLEDAWKADREKVRAEFREKARRALGAE